MAFIEFTKDFAGKPKGLKWKNCPNDLANRLVNVRKVAKFASKSDTKPKATKKDE